MKLNFMTGLLAVIALLLTACAAVAGQTEMGAGQASPQAAKPQSGQDILVEQAPAEAQKAEPALMATQEQPEKTGPTAAQLQLLNNLPNNGPAPELLNDTFLNSETLRLADLRGKVVIVEFWTYG